MKNKPLLIVMGYQRSGTSFLTRAFNLCGVDIGPFEDIKTTFLEPASGNLGGDWESKTLTKLYLQTYPNQTPEELATKREMSTETTKYFKIYIKNLEKRQSLAYGFKIPNIMLLDSFLKNLSQRNIILVGIFRHPLKVAESSLGRFNTNKDRQKDYPKFLRSWLIHNKELISVLTEHGGFLINFDWDSKRLIDEINQIAKMIGLSTPDIKNWFNQELKHSDMTYCDQKLEPEILSTYKTLLELSEKNSHQAIQKIEYSNDELFSIFRTILTENIKISQLVNDKILFYQRKNKELELLVDRGIIKSAIKKIKFKLEGKQENYDRFIRRE